MRLFGICKDDNPLLAAVRAGDAASIPALHLALREMVPSDSAFEELTRIYEFTSSRLDLTVDWSALMKLDQITVSFLICTKGGAFFRERRHENWNHPDGIYGWSSLKPKTHPIMLQGDHFEAYSTQANIEAISTSIASGIERAKSGSSNSDNNADEEQGTGR